MTAPKTVTVQFTDTGEKRDIQVSHWLPGRVENLMGGKRIQLAPNPDWSRVLPGYRVVAMLGGAFIATLH